MCTRPNTRDGNTFACRTCDECIATRRHGWVARAMMEKTQHKFAMCLAFTYDDSTEANRDAARMFQYDDMRAFFHRLRRAIRYKFPEAAPEVRFLVAGEQGDRNKRCHWHAIIYSGVDLCSLGTFETVKRGQRKRSKVTERQQMLSAGKRKIRLNWSLWGKGYVTLQEPDQGAMNYVLSYVLKDQFTEEKSRDTMREAKSENFATGIFRMSKRPAIGEAFLYGKLAALDAANQCLPSLNLKVPGFHGYYHPSGSFREKMLWALVALNQRAIWTTGAPAPQWSSLLASCSDNQSDLEVLLGPQENPQDLVALASELATKQRDHAGQAARRDFARTCGAELPCEACLGALSDATLSTLGVERLYDNRAIFYVPAQGFEPVETRQSRFAGRSNPHCQKRGSLLSRHTFPNSDRTRL